MELGLRNATALVAGGSRGMGRAIAELLAVEGCRVAVLGRTEADLRDVEARLYAKGAPEVLVFATNLLDTAQVNAAVAAVESRWNALNALVCAAGPSGDGTIEELDDCAWFHAFDEGVMSAVRCVRAALPALRRASFGRIVTLAATSTRHQNPRLIAYTAAKSALVSITKNLARSLAPEGILVNCICPGWVLTPSIAGYLRQLSTRLGLEPDDHDAAFRAGVAKYGAGNDIGRIGRAEEVAAMAVLLCSPLASYTVGAIIPIDGGTDFF